MTRGEFDLAFVEHRASLVSLLRWSEAAEDHIDSWYVQSLEREDYGEGKPTFAWFARQVRWATGKARAKERRHRRLLHLYAHEPRPETSLERVAVVYAKAPRWVHTWVETGVCPEGIGKRRQRRALAKLRSVQPEEEEETRHD